MAYQGITVAVGGSAFVFDRTTGVTQLATESGDVRALAISASGLEVIWRTSTSVARRVIDSGAATQELARPLGTPEFAPAVSPSGRYVLTAGARLNDFDFGTSSSLPFVPGGGDVSADDRWLAVVSGTATLVTGDTNAVDDVFVLDLPDVLDADDDTMDDRWETLFGVTDPAADPDGDGQTNAQEEDAGTHPNAQIRRFLAEGATGTFFRTKIALANPDPTQDATAVVTFQRGDGVRVRRPFTLPAGRSMAISAGAVVGLEAADVSTTVESRPLRRRRTGDDVGHDGARSTGRTPRLPRPRRRRRGSSPKGSTVLELRPVLPAAEPAGDHDQCHGPLPAAVGDDDHPQLQPARPAAAPRST